MTIRFVLALAGPTAHYEGALQLATKLGQSHQSHVEILLVTMDPSARSPSTGGVTNVHKLLTDADNARAITAQEARQARAFAEAACRSTGTTLLGTDATIPVGTYCAVWHEVSGRAPRELAQRGQLFDVVVVPRPDPVQAPGSFAVAEAALFETGRTVILAPPEVSDGVGQSPLVAWNGSPQAARAVQAALPFLAQAKRVLVASLTDEGGSADTTGIVHYLAGHGIAAETRAEKSDKGAVGERLLDTVRASSSDLLVMGAYGHSRLKELMLGGATESVLKYAQVPVLMAH